MLFFAGFDTQAISLQQILHQLVKNESIQEKLMTEIQEALEANDGQITYEMVENLKYLDWTIKEGLR